MKSSAPGGMGPSSGSSHGSLQSSHLPSSVLHWGMLGIFDSEPLVRAASAWGLGRQATFTAISALEAMLNREVEPFVLAEIRDSLGRSA